MKIAKRLSSMPAANLPYKVELAGIGLAGFAIHVIYSIAKK
jgi:hypothetical protein